MSASVAASPSYGTMTGTMTRDNDHNNTPTTNRFVVSGPAAAASTRRPAPPPKPSHLSSVFTGTLNSDALKSYIRQHSMTGSVASRSGSTSVYGSQIDTFRTSNTHNDTLHMLRTTGHDDDGGDVAHRSEASSTSEDDDAAWGTARQAPIPSPRLMTSKTMPLADLFAPVPPPSTMFEAERSTDAPTVTSSQLTVRASPSSPPLPSIATHTAWLDDVEAHRHEGTIDDGERAKDDDVIATVKLGKEEILAISSRAEEDTEGEDHIEALRASMRRRAAQSSSSDDGTLRSRQPSILSRLSAFDEDDYEDDHNEPLQPPPVQTAESTPMESTHSSGGTPKKQWMHARDGSAFERASPRPSNKSRLLAAQQKGSRMQEIATTTAPWASSTGLPILSDGLPVLTMSEAPPPPPPQEILEEAPVVVETAAPVQAPTSATAPTHLSVVEGPTTKSNLSTRRRETERGAGKQARALYAFDGEASFNELSLSPGQMFEILKEDMQDGWSLAAADQAGKWTKGLVPRGWYIYTQEFTMSPPNDSVPTVNPAAQPHVVVVEAEHPPTSDITASIPVKRDSTVHDEPGRPASGFGQMSTSHGEATSAVQILTQMKSSGSQPLMPTSTSMLRKLSDAATGSRILAQPISEVSTDDLVTSAGTPMCKSASFDGGGVSDDSISTTHAQNTDMNDSQTSISTSSVTGAWRPPGLLGGRSLNRFAPIVVSGAEQYILSTSKADAAGASVELPRVSKADNMHTVISGPHGGPAWKHEGLSIVAEVHSPEVHVDDRGKEYTAYVVHASYLVTPDDERTEVPDPLLVPDARPDDPTMASSVYRRFNQFRWLANHLAKLYPGIMLSLPPIPDARHTAGWTARFEPLFVERRRRHLQSWLTCIVRHPVLSKDAGLRFFLDSEEEEGEEWLHGARAAQRHMLYLQHGEQVTSTDAPVQLFAHTIHPMFNVDTHEAALEAKQIALFTEVYQRAMGATDVGMLQTYANVRSATASNSDAYRQLSLSVLRLITGADGTGAAPPPPSSRSPLRNAAAAAGLHGHEAVLPPMGNVGRRGPSGATNEDRAWCWREGCQDCRRLTRAMQTTAAAMQVVADDHRAHAVGGQFDVHDRLHTLSKSHAQQTALMEVHASALAMYRAATAEPAPGSAEEGISSQPPPSGPTAERIAARCETVLNVTLSEMDRIHAQRVQDWNALSRQLLDEQIGFYEDVLHNLQRARVRVDEVLEVGKQTSSSTPAPRAPVLPSPYETQLTTPVVHAPLEQPTMQLLETSAAAKAIRPVALASEVLSDWLGGGSMIR